MTKNPQLGWYSAKLTRCASIGAGIDVHYYALLFVCASHHNKIRST